MPTHHLKCEPCAPTTRDLNSLVDERTAASFLGFTVRALQNWRIRGGGPQFVRVSRRSIRYRWMDLMQWAEARLCVSTSQKISL